jgi:hypothetical protein
MLLCHLKFMPQTFAHKHAHECTHTNAMLTEERAKTGGVAQVVELLLASVRL